MSEEIETAERNMVSAGQNLRQGKESEYADAYQVLVRLGARQQIKRKYR